MTEPSYTFQTMKTVSNRLFPLIILHHSTRIVPVVEFPSTRSEIAEPLSNSSLDLSLLTLEVRRRGDISVASTVSYTTVDVTARGGADYEPVSGVLQFEEGSNVAEIAIRALANHKREEDTEFLVQLSLPPITTDQPTTIGENSTMRVLVRNLPLLGPYFPALPQLDNVRSYGERLHTAGLYYDLPLACITVSVPLARASEGTVIQLSYFPGV